jgi:hypothetical protein
VKVLTIAAMAGGFLQGHAFAVLTPEQRAGAGGQISNPSAQEYYLGAATFGNQYQGLMYGAFNGVKPSLTWYKYHSDGVTGVVFDTYGSNVEYGYMGFGSKNDTELAIYNANGQFICSSQGTRAPTTGDSTVMPVPPPGAGPMGAAAYRQPEDPRNPAIYWSSSNNGWYGNNTNDLATISCINNAQPHPVWEPSHPQYNPYADWDEYGVLPAGDYFVAVTGYSTYFAGNGGDASAINEPWYANNAITNGQAYPNADGPITPTTPFGFVSFHAMTGVYAFNVRRAGDLDFDGDADSTDMALLQAKIAEFAPTNGIASAGFANNDIGGTWEGMPVSMYDLGIDLTRFDITGNHRIDAFDLAAFSRMTGIAPAAPQWNLDGSGSWNESANWTGGVPNAIGAPANFLSKITSAATVTLDSAVVVGAMKFDNANSYTIAGTGSITLDVSAGSATIDVVSGKHKISVPVVVADSAQMTIAGSSVLTLGNTLTINSGQTVKKAGSGLLITGTLDLQGTAKLDVSDSKMVVDYSGASPVASIRSMIVSGRNSGAWNGAGINSSAAAANTDYAVGYKDTSVTGTQTFNGESIDASAILVAYTLTGDATLDGLVSSLDFNAFVSGYGKISGGHWFEGDFNYDNKVNTLDFNMLAGHFGQSVPAPVLGTVVPEPGVGLGALILGTFAARRRKRSHLFI